MAWGLGTFVTLLVLWLWRRGMRPAPNDLTDPGAIVSALRLLITRGVHKSSIRGKLTIQPRAKKQPQLVFTKHLSENGEFGIQSTLRLEGPLFGSRDRLREALDARKVKYSEVRTSGSSSFSFELGRDFGLGLVITQIVFQEVIGISVARDCVAYFHDYVIRNTPSLTGVDSPDGGWG
jgi:hypothetical protein